VSRIKEKPMKYRWMLAAAVLAACQTGCESNVNRDLKPRGAVNLANQDVNSGIVRTYNLQSVDAAVIREHTLYPYHFVVNSANLNELGWRDVELLASHYQSNPGPLNVRKGATPDDLYKARVRAVVNAMTRSGVKMDRIKVADGMPGGDGISSDEVVLIMDKMYGETAGTGTGAKSGASKKDESNMNKSPTGTPRSSGVGNAAGTAASTGGTY
jgi:hypothetical protein